MKRHIRRILSALLLSTIVVVFFSAPTAHAITDAINEAIIGFGSDFAGEVMKAVIGLLEAFKQILVQILSWCGQILNWVIGLEINYGGVAVYQVWKIFRDICNGLFIVLFIFVAFGTIFNVTLKNNPFYYQGALKNVILAALLINFSLPIGQIIVWAGNKATTLVSSTMGTVDVATVLLTKGQLPQVVVGKTGLSLSQVPFVGTPDDQLNPLQRASTATYTDEAADVFEECRANGSWPLAECSARAARVQAPAAAEAAEAAASKPDFFPLLKKPFSDAVLYWSNAARGAVKGGTSNIGGGVTQALIGAAQGAWDGASLVPPPDEPAKQTLTEQALQIVSMTVNLFFLGVLVIGLLVVIIFMVLRLPMIWFYLAMSALAFFSIGVPGSKLSKEWFKNMVGWNIFAPLYLFAIYIGMMVLSNEAALLDGLKGAGTLAGLLGVTLFYCLTGGIFIFGAKAAWGYAFDWSDSLKNQVTKATDTLGVGEKSNFGASTLARRTGIPSKLEGARTAIAGKFEDRFVKPQLRREEEWKARWQAKFGDAKAYDVLKRKRVEDQAKKDKEGNKTVADLRKTFNEQKGKGIPDEKFFAAARALLDEGELSDTEMRLYQQKAGQYSVPYGQAAKEAVLKKLKERAKEKKFKDAAAVITAIEQLGPASDESESLIKGLASSDPRLYAELLDQKIGTREDLQAGKTSSQLLDEKAAKLTDEDWVKVFKSGRPLGENAAYILNSKLSGKGSQKMLFAADRETRAKLREEIKKRKKAAAVDELEAKEEVEQIKQEAAEVREAENTARKSERAANQAVSMAGGVSKERQREIQQEMEEYKKNNPNG